MTTKKKKTPAKKANVSIIIHGPAGGGGIDKTPAKKAHAPAVKGPVKCWACYYANGVVIAHNYGDTPSTIPSMLFDATPKARERRIEVMAAALFKNRYKHSFAYSISTVANQCRVMATAAHDAIFNGEEGV